MAKKNPAINFYTSDFLTGTTFMSNEQVGAYIRLLSYQHQLGHLTEEQVFAITKDSKVLSKFSKDKKGLFFNKRMEFETKKKQKYSESRAKNRLKSTKKEKGKKETYDKHMINISSNCLNHMENENENIYIYINNILNNNYSNNTNIINLFNEYITVRKKKKQIISETVVNRLIKKLNDYGKSDDEKVEIITNAINGAWKDFYPLSNSISKSEEVEYETV